MCGICGTVGFDKPALLESINRAMVHRGPDDGGIWFRKRAGLGHRRLSIIDLSDAGHQPMSNEDGTVWITFNGEIYNFKTLKIDLEKRGHKFRSRTDTEVVIHLYEEYKEECLGLLRGMFSFAIWDDKENRLFLARDRFGVKPLFYHFKDGKLIFSSELKAILAPGFIDKDINIDALKDYFIYGSVQAPATLIKDVFMLLPAHYIVLEEARLYIRRYWDLGLIKKESYPIKGEVEYIEDIRSILDEAVKIRMISDVPMGAFLSGGIDSSAITALMQKHSALPVRSFSVVFEEKNYSEILFQREIAQRLGTDHEEILVKEQDILKDIPIVFNSMDQPSADGFNTFVISKAVKDSGITVALSGLGGDELFGGYSSFRTLPNILKSSKMFRLLSKEARDRLAACLKRVVRDRQLLKLLFSFLKCESIDELYYLKRTVFLPDDIANILEIDYREGYNGAPILRDKTEDIIKRLSFLEITTYMQNTLLQDTDRMSMANSLEVRVPFLDHMLVERVFAIPGCLKIKKGYPKSLLVKSVQDLLPRQIYDRPKKGFVFPFQKWLKMGLRDYCSEILSIDSLRDIPYLNAAKANRVWLDFLNKGKLYNYTCILTMLSFVNWYKRNISNG